MLCWQLIPPVIGCVALTDEERNFALPADFGDLTLTNLTMFTQKFVDFQHLSALLISLILQQSMILGNASEAQLYIKTTLQVESGR